LLTPVPFFVSVQTMEPMVFPQIVLA